MTLFYIYLYLFVLLSSMFASKKSRDNYDSYYMGRCGVCPYCRMRKRLMIL